MLLELFTSFFLFLHKGVSTIGPFILLLGVLIFIHELGHFLAARYCNVKVEVFSLGFGPKIWKYKRGETLYAISLFPLGGYVKMFGDDPLNPVPASQRHRGFLYKKVPEKLLIAFGGPFMNLLFTFVAFLCLGWIGLPALKSQLGDVKRGTPAHQAGFRSGDQILSINGQPVSYWKDVNKIIQDHPSQNLSFQIKNQYKKLKTHQVKPTLKENENIFNLKDQVGFIEGLSVFSQSTKIGVRFNSPAYQAGLRTFDTISKVNNKPVKYWRDLTRRISQQKASLHLTIQREGKSLSFSLNPALSLKSLGIESTYLYISKVGKDTPAEQAGLKPGDRIVSVNNKKIRDWHEVLKRVQSFSGTKLSMELDRKGQIQVVTLTPKKMYVEGQIKERSMIGIISGGLELPTDEILKKETFLGAFLYSGSQTWHWLSVISIGLYRLIQGRVSVRTLGGPVTIGRVAHNSFHAGFVSFLFMMALISLNLFFLNLLPIPMLDGGHILFFTIEGILGRPLDIKKLAMAQQMGFFLLVFFFGLTFFNDISNWLNAW